MATSAADKKNRLDISQNPLTFYAILDLEILVLRHFLRQSVVLGPSSILAASIRDHLKS